jgi:hypothetical protein
MAMYTQVSSTAAYVGLNALEYIMQTVSERTECHVSNTNIFSSTSTPSCMRLLRNSSTLSTVAVLVACFRAWVVLQELSRPTRVLSFLPTTALVFFG